MFQVQIGSRQTVTNVSLQPWIAIKGSGSRQISHEKAHTKKANSHKEAQKGRHFDNKLEIHILFTSSILKHQSIQYQSQISIYYLS